MAQLAKVSICLAKACHRISDTPFPELMTTQFTHIYVGPESEWLIIKHFNPEISKY